MHGGSNEKSLKNDLVDRFVIGKWDFYRDILYADSIESGPASACCAAASIKRI